MKIDKIAYNEFIGKTSEWKLDELSFEDTNLLVGRNACGKTRTLNLVYGLARLLSGQIQPTNLRSGAWDAYFDHNGRKLHYELKIEDSIITGEKFECADRVWLYRDAKSHGTLWSEKENRDVEFEMPSTQLVAIARRDFLQHPYFEFLYEWGKSVSYFPFGSPMGQNQFLIGEIGKQTEPRSAEEVIAVFKRGKEDIGEKFLNSIKRGMSDIGYNIESIDLSSPLSISVNQLPAGAPGLSCLNIKEGDLTTVVDQIALSSGMFRAMSIIIQITYAEMISHPSCIIIDDIGEGLDFERSCKLIDLLIKRASSSNIQLIMATNDRFVMNKVPLQMWTVLQREKSHIHPYNYKNSKEKFDDFSTTGLNNFDFFSMSFTNQ